MLKRKRNKILNKKKQGVHGSKFNKRQPVVMKMGQNKGGGKNKVARGPVQTIIRK